MNNINMYCFFLIDVLKWLQQQKKVVFLHFTFFYPDKLYNLYSKIYE